MLNFLIDGGPVITIPQTALFIIGLLLIARALMGKTSEDQQQKLKQIAYIKYLGILALTLGLFGQIVGIYSGLQAIEEAGNVSPQLLYAGVRTSSITTLYGFVIFLIARFSKTNHKQSKIILV